MKAIFDYSPHDITEYKSWIVLKDEKENKFDKDIVSPWDSATEAHIVQTFYPLDNAVITFFPAKSTEDKRKPEAFHFKELFILILSNVSETESYSSYKMYNWEEVVSIASKLKDLSFTAALRIWKAKKY
ncbi:MAG TPA: hypothetical protein VM802_00735 [Chitinophaga sp.]|uniref:hypothetical protein n=1 Tax=Chitinophaga sp. TaxID=1869181 RepID=UPI002CA9CD55|nr:hypothetical protein [Chitinophaga sp.]HVI43356.1 hypothetical protein [Chitinophaga sp.]